MKHLLLSIMQLIISAQLFAAYTVNIKEEYRDVEIWEEGNYRYYEEYNDAEKQKLSITLYSDDEWISSDTVIRTESQFNTKNQITLKKTYNTGVDGSNLLLQKEEMYYYTNELLDSILFRTYTQTSSNINRKEYFYYNGENQLIEKQIHVYAAGDWFKTKLEYVYDNGLLVEENEFSENGSAWDPEFETTFTYDASDQLTESLTYVYNLNEWELNRGTEFLYDEQGNEADVVNFTYSFEQRSNTLRTVNTYNQDGNIILKEQYEASGEEWNLVRRLTYTYSEIVASLTNTETSNEAYINNPVTNWLKISGEVANPKSMIYDSQGNEVLNSINENIDVRHLNEGIYFIRIGKNQVYRFYKK